MQGGNHLRAFADRAADALDRTGAHIADREHTGDTGLEQRNSPIQIFPRESSRDDKPGAVEIDAAILQPGGGGVRADKQKHVACVDGSFLAGLAVAIAHALEPGLGRAVHLGRFQSAASIRCSASPRYGRSDSATCWPQDRHRESSSALYLCERTETPPPVPPNCRRRQGSLPARRTIAPRSERPSTTRRVPRRFRDFGSADDDNARRWRSRSTAPEPYRRPPVPARTFHRRDRIRVF